MAMRAACSRCGDIDTVEGFHLLAVDVGARVHSQLATEFSVVIHAVVGGVTVFVALQASVDDVNGEPEAWIAVGISVFIARAPVAGDDAVNVGDLGVSVVVPEPQARLEGDQSIRGHQVRVAEQVQSEGLSTSPVVVVPVMIIDAYIN